MEQGFFHCERRAVGADIAGDSKDDDNRNRNTDGSESRGGNSQRTKCVYADARGARCARQGQTAGPHSLTRLHEQIKKTNF